MQKRTLSFLEGLVAETSLHPDEALGLVLSSVASGGTEILPLAECLGRSLLAPLLNLCDQPPFDRATMDGFALPAGSPPQVGTAYSILGTSAAGSSLGPALAEGQCLRIMTGAALPPGALMVQRVERTRVSGETMTVTALEDSLNVNPRGANLKAGEVLIDPRRLNAKDLGVLASSGYGQVEVGRRPVVGVLSTGDELRSPGEALGPTSIYDSNGPTLAALAAEAGAVVKAYGIVRDDPEALRASLGSALAACDFVLSSGGVSMGDYDYLPAILGDLGVERVFHKVAMKPGKPLWFGRRPGSEGGHGPVLMFGLPGNPVSSFVGFELFVRPAIRAFQGLGPEPRLEAGRLAATVRHSDPDRLEFVPVALEPPPRGDLGPRVRPLRYTGSSMVQALAWADALLRLEIGTSCLEEGSLVDVRLLRP